MSDMQVKMEGEILKAVQNVGVNVDKDELLKALQYDRNQYQKGYDDRDSEIVRCKDCALQISCTINYEAVEADNDDWFCASGVPKEGDDHEDTVAGGG